MIIGTMEDAKYRAMEGLAQSDLAWMKKSPQHFFRRKELQKETDAMRFGTVFHAAILEPKRFLESYVVEPSEIKGEPVNRRTKAHREYLDGWRIENAGKFIMTPKQYDNLIGMAQEIAKNPLIKNLIGMGNPEVVATWDYRGRKCKGKADLWIESSKHGKVIVDFKKTQDASPVGFARSVHNYNYSLQAEFYRLGFQADKVIMIAVEENHPHPIGIYDMHDWSDSGTRLMNGLLDRLDYCEKANEWPWYTTGIELLAPPTWLAAVSTEENSDLVA